MGAVLIGLSHAACVTELHFQSHSIEGIFAAIFSLSFCSLDLSSKLLALFSVVLIDFNSRMHVSTNRIGVRLKNVPFFCL